MHVLSVIISGTPASFARGGRGKTSLWSSFISQVGGRTLTLCQGHVSSQFRAPRGQGLCLPLNEVHIASRSPWGPALNWHPAQHTCGGAGKPPLAWGVGGGQATSPGAIQALQITQITLQPRATSLLGEGRLKLVASEHNKLKTRQRLLNGPRGNQRFYEPVIFTIIQ